MTRPKNPKTRKLTAAALIAAATAEMVRHNTKLDPAWQPPGDSDDMRTAISEFAVEAHDLRPVVPAMTEGAAAPLAPAWDLEPDLRRGAVPIFRRAIEGVVAHADRGMRRHGWLRVAQDTGHTHHGGATWARNGEQVTLHACVQPALPMALLERADAAAGDEEEPPALPWPAPGTVVHVIIRAHKPGPSTGHRRLAECLADAIWRREDTRESRPPAADDIALTEVTANRCRWTQHLSEVYFRRENEGGMLPAALRTQLQDLRGKVVFHEILATRLDEVRMSNGTVLRPDGDTTRIVYKRYAQQPDAGEGATQLPDLEPGEVRVVARDLSMWRHLVPPTITRVGPGELIPSEILQTLQRRPRWAQHAALEGAVRHSLRWKMEDAEGA